MGTVNVSELRSILQTIHPARPVMIHAAVLLAILNAYKTSAGSDVSVSMVTPSTPEPPYSLLSF